ncbi:MAG: uracil-DNA glycosylase [Proteobacteria bacterium]|nr:uracil-DNA glycosylase [Pseudomonadota bacterium]
MPDPEKAADQTMDKNFFYSLTGEDRLISVLDEIKTSLACLAELGVKGVDCSRESLDRLEKWGKGGSIQIDSLESISDDIRVCNKCSLHRKQSKKPLEKGPENAALVFVVHWPDTEPALPFSGPSGELLLKIIQAMHIQADDIYILNILKCRPDGDISPFSDDTKACMAFLMRQLVVIKPKVICAMGPFAAHALLNTDRPLDSLRGRFHEYHGISVMPTHHPDMLMVNPEKKRDVWDDVKKIMERIGL